MPKLPIDPKLIRDPKEEEKNAEKFSTFMDFLKPFVEKYFHLFGFGGLGLLYPKKQHTEILTKHLAGHWIEFLRQSAQDVSSFNLTSCLLPDQFDFSKDPTILINQMERLHKFYQSFNCYEIESFTINNVLNLIKTDIKTNYSIAFCLDLPFNLLVAPNAQHVRVTK